MRRMILAGVIALTIALLGIWEQNCIRSVCSDMKEKLTETERLIQKGEYEKAENNTEDVKKFWQKQENILDVLIRHDDTDDITLDIDVLKRYISLEDKTLALASVDELRGQFDEIREKTKIHYTNIF